MPGVRAHRKTLLLAGIALVLWGAVFVHAFHRDAAWLDDAFITLHAAGNVLEQGTARYFPIAENPSLLASSPLRMLLLVPSLVLARSVTEAARTVDEAAVAFVLAGVLTSLLAGVFFRGRGPEWLVGCSAAALLALGTESALQMEGLLLAWLAWALLRTDPFVAPGRAGLLVGLLLLSRPEFGLAALLVVAGALGVQSRGDLPRFAAMLLLPGVAWIVIATLLGVWPVPTTVLTKILSARNEVFVSPPFGRVWSSQMRDMFLFGQAILPLVWLMLAVVVAALAASGRAVLAGLGVWYLAMAVLWKSPGNYPWYHENVAILLLVLAAAALTGQRLRRGLLPWLRTACLALFVGLFLLSSVGRDRSSPYGFEEGPRRGRIYQEVAGYHVGQGQFRFPAGDVTYLHVTEIGMIAWFAGGDVWLADHFALAQVDNLAGAHDTAVSPFYPEALFRDYIGELQGVVPDPGESIALSGIEIDPLLMRPERCTYRSPAAPYCIVPFYEGPAAGMSRRDPRLPRVGSRAAL